MAVWTEFKPTIDTTDYENFAKLERQLLNAAAAALNSETGRPLELRIVFDRMIAAFLARLKSGGRPYMIGLRTKVYESDGELSERFHVRIIRAFIGAWKLFLSIRRRGFRTFADCEKWPTGFARTRAKLPRTFCASFGSQWQTLRKLLRKPYSAIRRSGRIAKR
jgi:hypothetical protein